MGMTSRRRAKELDDVGIPSIPQRDTAQVRRDLLESFALEEAALANLINAQAAKVQALADSMPQPSTFEEAADMQRLVLAILQTAGTKGLVASHKLRQVLHMEP